ncbi:MAG: ATP-binding protein [Desulfobacteraceae bacterium]|nr:ATP-binding protein [Desulfobacteraceae bacterium]
MKTIRGKIIAFFFICLAFAGLLTALYYENAFSLRRKIYVIEDFDDLLNDVLELRRYEKNILLYKDPASLKEGLSYLSKVDQDYHRIKEEISTIIGAEQCTVFERGLGRYRQFLGTLIASSESAAALGTEENLRAEGKGLAEFAQMLILKKRQRIDQALQRVLAIPLASIGFLILLILFIFRFVTTGILKPLLLVRNATDQVARATFTPIAFDKDKQDEITRLMASFNKMVAELDSRQEQLVQSRKLASIGTLTSGIAHELNNPLNNISITAEAFMLNYPNMSDKEIKEMIEDIMVQTDRASQVVKNLLEFSRTERPSFRLLQPREIIERTLSLVKNQLAMARVRIQTDFAPELPAVRGKGQDLQQAFVNLLLNAIQAMPQGGEIKIRAGRGPQGHLRIDLADSGTGIKPEDLAHIFDPFYTTKESGAGTGLGLSIVYNIIRTHGGYIEVNSEVGKGSTFSIFLPIHGEKDIAEHELPDSRR